MHSDDDLAPTEGLPATPAPGADSAAGASLAPGTSVDRYRIEALVGQGGMGEVYRAQQLEPVRRTVALKLLRGQRLDARQLAYFEVERQMLARMQHPAIAQIFDAGTTADGLPYFAMEFIEGQPVIQWCDSKHLELTQRLELFARICEGVQHAHQKGVVHRDLKPGNILVTEVDGRPAPKIIDFGIATAAQRLRASAGKEDTSAGTPAYMSPEQAGLTGFVVDSRSDVYSLGVVLYELLTGTRPPGASRSDASNEAELHTTLRPPSALVDSTEAGRAIAAGRGLGARRFRSLLRHELDWVVMKAIRRDPDQRYASAGELAAELRRFLATQPLQAVPASRRYVLGKFARRHALGLAAGSAVLLALLVGMGLSLWGLRQAQQQREVAEARSTELERVSAFQQAMLEGVDVAAMGGTLRAGASAQLERSGLDVDAREQLEAFGSRVNWTDLSRAVLEQHMLQRALTALEADFADQPVLAADLRASVARVMAAIGANDGAAQAWSEVARQRASLFGEGHAKTIQALNGKSAALLAAGRLDDAEQAIARAVSSASGLDEHDRERIEAEALFGNLEFEQGRLEEALERFNALLPISQQAFGDFGETTIRVRLLLAGVQLRLGRYREGRSQLEEVMTHQLSRASESDPATQVVMSSLARARGMDGDFEGSLSLSDRLIAAMSTRIGAEHPQTLGEINTRVVTLIRSGQETLAVDELDRLVAAAERVLGPKHPATLRYLQNQASLRARLGHHQRAIELQQELFDRRRSLLGPRHPDVLLSHVSLGTILADAGRLKEAVPIVLEGCEATIDVMGEAHPHGADCLHVTGDILLRAGQAEAACGWLARGLASHAALHGDSGSKTIESTTRLLQCHDARADLRAREALRRSRIDALLALPASALDEQQLAARDALIEAVRQSTR